MKRIYILVILLFGVLFAKANLCDTVPAGVPQLFGGKYYKFNGYTLTDSFIMNAAGDTTNTPFFPSLKFKSSDNRWYGYDRVKWQKLLFPIDTVALSNRINAIVIGINQLTGDVIAGPGSGSQVATIATNVVTNAKLRQSAGLSVIGNSSISTSNVADITAGTDGQALRRNGTAIGFGAIDLSKSAAVTGVLPINNTDTTNIKNITSRRTGVRPSGYAGASIIVDTSGRILQAEAVRNNMVSVNNVGVVSAFGKIAAHFDASLGQALVCPSNPTLQGGASDLTIACWAKMDALTAGNLVLVAKDDNRTKRGSEYLLGFVRFGTEKFQFQVEECCHLSPNDGTTWLIASHVSTGTGDWHFVVGQYDHIAGKLRIWVDMIKDSLTGVPNVINTTNTPFVIGGLSDDYDTTGLPEPASYWNGAIKSVGLWHRVLDSTELVTLFNMTPAQLPPPGANPGTMINGPTFSADVPTVLAANVYSVNYDGVNDKTAMTSGVPINVGNSVSLWFKATAFGGMVLGQFGSAQTYVRVFNSTTIRVQTNITGTFKDYSVPTMSTGTWYNLIVTRDNSNLTHVYLNGTESSTGGLSQTDPLTIDEVGLYWDGAVPGLNWTGKLSDIRFYGSILSSGDRSAIQANSTTVATPVTWYKLNEGTGTTNIDYGTAPVPHPLEYSSMATALKYESRETFVSDWDLNEPAGTTRYDARIRNTLLDNGVTNLQTDITHQDQNYFGSSQPSGGLWLNSTDDAAKGKIYLDSVSVYDGLNRRLGIGITNPDFDLVIKNPTGNAVDLALRSSGNVNTFRLSVDGSANTNAISYGSFNLTSQNSNSISLIPASGVTIGSSGFSTADMLEVKYDRTGVTDTAYSGYFHMTNAGFNTTTRAIFAAAVKGVADGQKTSGSNILTNIGLYGKGENGSINWALYADGKALVNDTLRLPNIVQKGVDTTGLKLAVVDAGGNFYKSYWPSNSSITSINSQTGPAYSISTGTGLTSSLGVNAIAISVDVNSTDLTHVVDKQFIDANNSGTAETVLYTKSIAANTLINNGASIHFDVAGQFNDATATADMQFYFGGTSFGNSGVLTLSTTGAWSATGYVMRATSTTARAFVTFTTQLASPSSYTFETDLTGLDFTTGNILKVTGQAGGATGGNNDITAKTWKLIFQP